MKETNFILFTFIIFILNTCYLADKEKSIQNNVQSGMEPFNQRDMNNNSFFSKVIITPIIKFSWGNEAGIPEIFSKAPLTNCMVENEPEDIRSHVKVKITPNKTYNLLTVDNTFIIADSNGILINKVKILPPSIFFEKWSIIDFFADEDQNIYLLDLVDDNKNNTYNFIRKINKNGIEVWQKKEKVINKDYNYQSINTNYQDFIAHSNHLYLCSKYVNNFSLFEINKETGSLQSFYTLNESYERVFMDKSGYLYYVKEKAENNIKTRFWTQYDCQKKIENFSSGNHEMYELLGIPVAVDDYGRGYVIMGFEMGCINKNSSYDWKQKIENILFDTSDTFIYTSKADYENYLTAIQINVFGNKGVFIKSMILKIPNDISLKYGINDWKLVAVDQDKLFVLGTNPLYYDKDLNINLYQKILITFTANGDKIKEVDYNPKQLYKNTFRLEGANYWQIDGEGNIYLPVLGSDGFYVFKMKFLNE